LRTCGGLTGIKPSHEQNDHFQHVSSQASSTFYNITDFPNQRNRLSHAVLARVQQGDARCVFIVRAYSLIAARLRASLLMDSIDANFIEGHQLPANVAKKVPERMVGRLLRADEARELLEAIGMR